MQREENCEVLARSILLNNSHAYSEGFVINAAADLPDGEYVVTFDGHALRVVKAGGLWLTSTAIARCDNG